MNIAILGAGAWGTALAVAFGRRHAIRLWARSAVQAEALQGSRCNTRYLPDVMLPATVQVHADLQAALAGADLVLIVTPTAALRDMLHRLRAFPSLPVLWACKGFEAGSANLPHRVVAAELGSARACGVLSGPSFAQEVAQGKPTALTLAAQDESFASATARELHHPLLRVYYSSDVVGVEVGGAVKNVLAIATGIADGLGLGLNARAALITRGLAEMTRLGLRLGGRLETFMGLTGMGDLVLTCTGDLSRNRRVGLALARGQTLSEVLAQLGHVAEGVHSAREVQRLAREQGAEVPITDAVCSVLFEEMSAAQAVQLLLSRDPRGEAQ